VSCFFQGVMGPGAVGKSGEKLSFGLELPSLMPSFICVSTAITLRFIQNAFVTDYDPSMLLLSISVNPVIFFFCFPVAIGESKSALQLSYSKGDDHIDVNIYVALLLTLFFKNTEDSYRKVITVDDTACLLEVLDTAGQEVRLFPTCSFFEHFP
jgi:hypothetical protein